MFNILRPKTNKEDQTVTARPDRLVDMPLEMQARGSVNVGTETAMIKPFPTFAGGASQLPTIRSVSTTAAGRRRCARQWRRPSSGQPGGRGAYLG